MEAMRFRFDGQPINETDTPSQVIVCLNHLIVYSVVKVDIYYRLILSGRLGVGNEGDSLPFRS